ncbi:MAG: methyltransferase domain-containing protein [Bacteroidia bacterium]
MSKAKQILSYLWDIPIEKSSSPQNSYLEVVWSQGKKMLNTENANYSFGNGYKVFELAFEKHSDRISQAQNVLVLGFGCGSVLQILRRDYKSNCQITGIEYDAEIIRLFYKHFSTAEDPKLELIQEDALSFVKQCEMHFDLIIIDLFDDLSTSPLVFQTDFTQQLLRIANSGSTLIYNTVKSGKHQSQSSELLIELSGHFKEVSSIEFQGINQIITAF